jgi:hypothetical protein
VVWAKNLPYLSHLHAKIKNIFSPKEKVKVTGIFVKTKDPEKNPDKDPYNWNFVTRNTPVANTLKRRVQT